MDRKPYIGSLGAPSILTPGAPDPQKWGVKKFKKNSTPESCQKSVSDHFQPKKKISPIKNFFEKNLENVSILKFFFSQKTLKNRFFTYLP